MIVNKRENEVESTAQVSLNGYSSFIILRGKALHLSACVCVCGCTCTCSVCLCQVNGVDIMGRTQEELVAMLRSTKQGDSVCLVVARQEEVFLPRELVRDFSV